jgi:hypothetical protein
MPTFTRIRGLTPTLLLTAPLLLGLVAGCSSVEPSVVSRDTSTPTSDPAPPAFAPRWKAEVRVVKGPVISQDLAVVVERLRGGGLDLLGLDLQTGEERWRVPYDRQSRRNLARGRLTGERAVLPPDVLGSTAITRGAGVRLVTTRKRVVAYPDASADPRLW